MAFECHYSGPNMIDYIFALDSLNFCFWPHSTFDYQDLALNLKKIIEKDSQGLSPSVIKNFTLLDVLKIFPEDFPNLNERLEKIREVGAKPVERFEGDYKNLLIACENSVLNVRFS